jgi:hypothetical protein
MIQTAEEFYNKKDVNGLPMSFNEKMIEFAKLHVEAALKEAKLNIPTYHIRDEGIKDVENSILNAYPLSNIK